MCEFSVICKHQATLTLLLSDVHTSATDCSCKFGHSVQSVAIVPGDHIEVYRGVSV